MLQLLVTSLHTTVSSVVTQRLRLCLAAFAQLQSTLNIHMQPRITGFIWNFFFFILKQKIDQFFKSTIILMSHVRLDFAFANLCLCVGSR